MKKGLRGLFNRKKSKGGHQQQQAEPESTSPELPTDTGGAAPTAPARAGDDTNNGSLTLFRPIYQPPPNTINQLTHHITVDYAQRAEAPTSSAAHHISEPSGMEEAKAVDLNPTPTSTHVNTAPTAPTKLDEGTLAPIGTKAEPSSTGMSATSGPLGDHMAEVYQEVDHTEEGGETVAVEGEGVKRAQ